MHSGNPSIFQKARTWFNSSLFNTDLAGEYFEYLVEGIDPMWSVLGSKARIKEVIEETADTKTWVMEVSDGWKGFSAGQHIHITASINGVNHTRTFTISSSPQQWRENNTISITVKRVPNGRATGWMHEQLKQGDIIAISEASGDFVLDVNNNDNIGYIAAGSGITPIMSQLRWLTYHNMPAAATLLYFANTDKDFIFGSQLKAMDQTNERLTAHFVASYETEQSKYKLPQAPICSDHITALMESQPKRIYICGPHPFREIAKSLLKEAGFNMSHVYEEAFGLPPVKVEEGQPVTVSFSKSAIENTTETPDTLLNMAEAAGLKPNAGCRMGICYTCKCKKTSGQVRNIVTGEVSSSDPEDIQLCVSTPVSNVEIDI